MMKINFDSVPEFDNEFDKIVKRKCKSLVKDLEIFKKAVTVRIPEHPSTKAISDLGESVKIPIYKVKRFRCRAINRVLIVDFVLFMHISRIHLL